MSVQTVNTTMSVPAVGEMIVAISSEKQLSTGLVVKSYATIGVVVHTLAGQMVVIEDGTEYTIAPKN